MTAIGVTGVFSQEKHESGGVVLTIGPYATWYTFPSFEAAKAWQARQEKDSPHVGTYIHGAGEEVPPLLPPDVCCRCGHPPTGDWPVLQECKHCGKEYCDDCARLGCCDRMPLEAKKYGP